MLLPGSRGQQNRDQFFDASGTITTGGTAQLLLPERKSTSFLYIQNISNDELYLEFGSARATATLTNGVVTSVAITNGGFGFTIPPVVKFLGGAGIGWNYDDGNYAGCGEPLCPSPSNFARGRALLTAGSVSSIVVDLGGSGYLKAPYVFIENNLEDPFGCATPSATDGIELNSNGGSWTSNGTTCTTDSVSIFGGTTGQQFTCKWMP